MIINNWFSSYMYVSLMTTTGITKLQILVSSLFGGGGGREGGGRKRE